MAKHAISGISRPRYATLKQPIYRYGSIDIFLMNLWIMFKEFLDEVATDILYMHSERIDYYKGNFSRFYATKEERRKNQIREYEAQMAYRKHLQEFIDRWRYNAKRGPQAQSKLKILEKLPVIEAPEVEQEVKFRQVVTFAESA
jgi:ATPase subunit of ABC transporter with duplicated ATPase domains